MRAASVEALPLGPVLGLDALHAEEAVLERDGS